ncbi:conserved hypothetical protein [Histoplasma capsulatum G186AR]|uniref:Uncharacterized protein n=2 Tax=Ajellomyces capsulatus TaxID=5037 RepID=C0NKP3_AJECG|nr:uncharacterized protein HCBG_03723 [Histoplasma capsulatum G186AR]EEH08434.1 conserved hypothetical protein [Histoplasma capsulatum G186AR]
MTFPPSAAAESPSTHGLARSSAQVPGITDDTININDKRSSITGPSRRRLHPPPPPPPRIYTHFAHYNTFLLPDDSSLPHKPRHRRRHSPRHRDLNHPHSHSNAHSFPHLQLHPHLHHRQEGQQQQQHQQQLDSSLLDEYPNRNKPATSSELKKEKSTYRHKRHGSRGGRFPKTVRNHASMSLRPGKHANRDKGSRVNGVGEPGVVDTAVAAQHSETNGLETSDSGSSSLEEKLPFRRRRENVTMAEVRRERRRRMEEEESNRAALTTLSALSTTITRRLDTTYYTLLEKIASLHSAIYSFHTLSTAAFSLHSDFTRETDNLSRATTTQIDEFHSAFTHQIKRIDALEMRMRAGAEKAEALNRRMEVVRGKIEAWDRREGEWQRRVTTRLRIFWTIVGTAVVVLVVAWVVQQLKPVESSMGKGIGIGDMDTGIGLSAANLTCELGGQGLRDGKAVWESRSFETSGEDTCSRQSLQE